MSDYETEKAAVLARRAEEMALIEAYLPDASESVMRQRTKFVNARNPLPKREPAEFADQSGRYRVSNGAVEIWSGTEWIRLTVSGPHLATMRALVEDADAQERGE